MGRDARLTSRGPLPRRGILFIPLAAVVAAALPACGGGPAEVPSPRPIVVFSGERVHADSTEMVAVDRWVRSVQTKIGEEEALHMEVSREDDPGPPWEAVRLEADGPVEVRIPRRSGAAETPYRIYAFLQMMDRRGELDEWLALPDAERDEEPEEVEPVDVPDESFQREKDIVDRVAAVWLLGRAIFDTAPFSVLDELVYAREYGYLEAYLLTARGDEFPERREEWLAENPDALEEYRAWFRATFENDPPGWDDVADLGDGAGGSERP